MDDRLTRLEDKMKRSVNLREQREEIVRMESKGAAATRQEDEILNPRRKTPEKNKEVTDRQTELTDLTSLQSGINFKSTWALQMEEELRKAANAGMTGMDEPRQKDKVNTTTKPVDKQQLPGPSGPPGPPGPPAMKDWEAFLEKKSRKKMGKIRKPPVERKDWFGDNTEDDSLSSSSSSDQGEKGQDEWEVISRKKERLMKKKLQKDKRKDKMAELAERMQHMVGVGPISTESEKHFLKETNDPIEATKMAIREFLEYNLDFNEDELENLDIRDTKRAAKDNVLYFALQDPQKVKEIHYRKALSGNNDLIVRDYIPPQYHARYIALRKRATQMRAEDHLLKTQIRWGLKDVKIFTKEKGTQDQFCKQDLKDFMGEVPLPAFDTRIQWEVRKDNQPRRQLDFKKSRVALPSTGKTHQKPDRQGIVRQLSDKSRHDEPKKLRADSSSSEEDDDDDEDDEEEEDVNMEESTEDTKADKTI